MQTIVAKIHSISFNETQISFSWLFLEIVYKTEQSDKHTTSSRKIHLFFSDITFIQLPDEIQTLEHLEKCIQTLGSSLSPFNVEKFKKKAKSWFMFQQMHFRNTIKYTNKFDLSVLFLV